jgi:hypothetical protein
MNEHMLDEVHKIKNIFNDSQHNFTHMYSKLHEDFSQRVSEMVERTAKIDEVRNLYETQIEV